MVLFPQPPVIMSNQAPTHSFQVRNGQFQLDGKPFQILAGELHYIRVPHELWRQRIRMAKAMGLNTISTYVFWNIHEPQQGQFNFRGDADVAKFIRICQEEGMYVMLRPGPYVCAEWEFGGYPYWLLKDRKMKIRTADPAFLSAAQRYIRALAKQTVPLQITHGGNILMVQVENEYGSYGNNHDYMKRAKEMLTGAGYDVPLYVAEGGSQLASAWIPGTVAGVNGGSWPDIVKTVDQYTPGGPYISPEFYPGWLDHWGEPKSITDGDVSGFEKLISNGVSVSMYMFHGGTNFGFMNGANFGGHYQPGITSYDYNAPLDETGRPNQKYFAFREAISRVTGKPSLPIPYIAPTIVLPKINLKNVGSIWGTLPKPTRTKTPSAMEDLNQAYGDVLYQTKVNQAGAHHLEIHDLRDFAVVMVNQRVIGELDRRRGEHGIDVNIPEGGADLSLLVENSGRINYGEKIPDNLKGITKGVTLDGKEVLGWTNYPFPLTDPSRMAITSEQSGPSFYRGGFRLAQTGDGFFDMSAWHKGAVWINGHPLGRFWSIGAQQSLYVPSVWLKKGRNLVSVFDFQGGSHPYLESTAKPILNELKPEPIQPKRARLDLGHLPITGSSPTVRGEMQTGDMAQTFSMPTTMGRFLMLTTVSTFANEDYASVSEIELLDSGGGSLDRAKWKVAYVDSEETAQEDGSAENLIDGDVDSIWHSVWSVAHKGQPHTVVFDLGETVSASAVRLTPRQGDRPAKLRKFQVTLSQQI